MSYSAFSASGESLQYPETAREPRTDTYFGHEVVDPYRWLEEDVRQSDRVRGWVEAQNEVTFGYLQSLPQRPAIRERLEKLWDYEKFGIPFQVNGRYFMSHNDGLQNHSVIWTMESLDGDRRVLFDPNTWSDDGSVALGGLAVSHDGRLVAYAVQEAGSDWRTWKVRDAATGEDLPDVLENIKFSGISWDGTGEGFYYSKYPDPEPGEEFQTLNHDMKVMYHRLGDAQSEDRVVYYQPEHPEWGYATEVSDDGRFLVITVWVGTDDRYRVLVKDLLADEAEPIELIDRFEAEYSFIDNDGETLFFKSDKDAPRGKVIAIDLSRPEQHRVVIPERAEPLEGVNIVHNQFICTYLRDVATGVERFSMTGEPLGAIELPGLGSAGGFGGRREDTETFYAFESFSVPPAIYRLDLLRGETELLERADVDIDPGDYETRQVFFASDDGTTVPMFITHRKGIQLDGSHPTILYGYGGFNISIRPSFSISRMTWLELGGVYAVANIRGGGEYGQRWHNAGKEMQKQTVFDDFIAAAERLVADGYTRPERLAIMGGSNGGLLVGACMTQRPDLFGAAVPAVGVMDMLRFDQFTAGRFWTDEYGSASDSEAMFQYLRGYSPYHNLETGEAYPATLITTADTDDRVVPGHSFKFAARLQQAHDGNAPVLIRIETKAGHGSGRSTDSLLDEHADIYAFLAENLGLAVPAR